MSNLKRPRTSDWGTELTIPPEKRVVYESDSNYEEENIWQVWPESPENSFASQDSIPDLVETTQPFSEHIRPSLEELSQVERGFDNDIFSSSGTQEFDSVLSLPPKRHSQNVIPREVERENPNNVDDALQTMYCQPHLAPTPIKVCFGALCDVKVQLDKSLDCQYLDREGLNFREIITETQTFLTLQLSFSEEYCLLQTKEERSFGLLNTKAFRSITSLSCFHELEFTALIGCDDWRKTCFPTNKNAKLMYISLDIVVSGPQSQLEVIAKGLSQVGLFLQPPQPGTTTLPYENPQYLYLPGFMQVEVPSSSSHHQAYGDGVSRDLRDEQALDLSDRYPDFDLILEELPRHDYLKEAVVDICIKTQLLSYQKEALDFVVRRETLSSPDSRSLWESQSSDNKSSCFQHIITGAKSPNPDDFLGGILADDMGLGKSLTMLCAIVGSLVRANEYMRENSMMSGLVEQLGEHPRAAKSTLIIVPSALLLDSWIEEVDKHVFRGALRYCKYHGQERPKNPSVLTGYDIVLTTYGTVVADFSRSRNVLNYIKWYRVILDEAHVIRNMTTKQFRAVDKISAHIRWCLSGTPIQNTLADLGALVAFLRVPILKEPPTFRKYIEHPSRPSMASTSSNFKSLRLLLGSMCLRRGKNILPLFGLELEEKRVQFSTTEREEYRLLQLAGRKAIDLAVSGHNTKATHQSVIESLLRLRLFCNNGSLNKDDDSSSYSLEPEEILSLLQQSGEASCKYCSCDIASMSASENSDCVLLTECHRLVCGECRTQYENDFGRIQMSSKNSCPFCSDKHDKINLSPKDAESSLKTTSIRKSYPSKLLALLEDVRSNSLHEKTIIFSFWKKSLDLVREIFTANGIQYLRVDGSLSLGRRRTVLSEFQVNPEIRVLVMTLGTGAIGLNNLSVASRIYLLEPQWNPSVENQAIGRIFRLGQERPVTVVRYIMDKTIEDSVRSQQLRKLRLACGGFDGKTSSQKIEQLQQLKAVILGI